MLAPTRSNLQLLRRRLGRVTRGAALLRHKREVLVVELFKVARPALAARERIGADAKLAWEALFVALAEHGEDGLRPLGGRRLPDALPAATTERAPEPLAVAPGRDEAREGPWRRPGCRTGRRSPTRPRRTATAWPRRACGASRRPAGWPAPPP